MRKTSFRYLNQNDILSLNMTLDDVLCITEKALDEHARKTFEMPPKFGINPHSDAFINAMPAFLPGLKIAGLKWVSCYPRNWERDLPTIMGLAILNDIETGEPLCVLDGTWLTATRTAAVSGIAVKHLLRENSQVLGMIGAGTQGRFHTGVIKHICPSIREVMAFDINPEQLNQFQSHIQDTYGLTVKFAQDPEMVFRESDIVVTATTADRPQVKRDWLKEGGLYIGLESFRYWGEEALLSVDKLVTDDSNQAQAFLMNSRHIQKFPRLYGELSEIVTGNKPGREAQDEKVLCIFIGMAIVDLVLGNLVYHLALERGIGTRLPL